MKEIEIGKGWNVLIEKVYSIQNKLSFAIVTSITKEHGMLKINFQDPLDNDLQYVLDCIAYRIQRQSARMCELCGAYGESRKNLPEIQYLCTPCYAIKLSDVMESMSPIQVTPINPSKDMRY